MKNIFLFILFVTVYYSGYNQNSKSSKQDKEIVILHVNDIHGRIDQFPVLSAMVKDIKSKHKNVILVSAGDLFSGNPIVDKYPEKGYPMIDLMNNIPFDMSVFGNHEFDFGPDVLAQRIKDAKFPFIACNLTPKAKDFPEIKPFLIIKKDKIKISILGITQVGLSGHPDTHPDKCKEFIFEDGIKKAKEFSNLSKKSNVFIVLSHMGYEEDSLLSLQMPEINTIIGGHSHKTFQPARNINGVTVVQAGSYLKYLGMLTITLHENKVISIKDTLLPLKFYQKSDTLLLEKIKKYNDNKEFSKVVGYLGTALEGDNELGTFMADACLRNVRADFAFQNSGGIRVHEMKAGPITVKQVYELDPFSNEIMVCKMTPSQIRELIAFGYNKEKRADLISAGIISEIHLNKDNTINKIELYLPDGSKLDEQKVYVVAVNSYISSSYVFSKTGEPVSTGITTTDALLKLLSEIKSINYSGKISTKTINNKE